MLITQELTGTCVWTEPPEVPPCRIWRGYLLVLQDWTQPAFAFTLTSSSFLISKANPLSIPLFGTNVPYRGSSYHLKHTNDSGAGWRRSSPPA